MLAPEARRRKVRKHLQGFLDQFAGEADRTRRRFFRQAIGGIVCSGSLIVRRWCRWINDDRCHEPFYRQKRLLNQLGSEDWKPTLLRADYQRWAGTLVSADTPLLVDLTDLAKPRARKLPYLALVRDGSDPDERLVNGYWCLEIYARLPGKKMLPLLVQPYSIDDPAVLSENAQVLAGTEQVMAATAGKGVLVMDIGGDRGELLVPWIDRQYPFVVRQRGDRTVLLEGGSAMSVAEVAEHLLAAAAPAPLVWCKVFLPTRPAVPLWLVCHQTAGHERPLMLLTNLAVLSVVQARNVRGYYRQRWGCEEDVRWLKQEIGLEAWCVRRYHVLPTLLLLACWAMAFLTWMLLHAGRMLKKAVDKCPGYRQVRFVYYRVLRFLQELAFTVTVARLPPTRRQNG